MSIGDAEIKTQERVIRFFKDPEILGYQYIGNLSDYQNKNIKEDRLRQYLRLKGYADKLIDAAIMQLQQEAGNLSRGVYDANKTVYSRLKYGIPVSESPEKPPVTVQLVDEEKPLNNDFAIAEEVTVVEQSEKRPDLVVYLNGIAVAVIELKRSSISVSEGIRQNLTNQKNSFIQSFFTTMQFCMAGNESEGLRYGTLLTGEKFYMEWKAKLKEKWGTMQKVYSSRSRLEKVAWDIIQDFNMKPRLMDGNGNAILVADGIPTACKYYEIFQQMGFKKCAIISSYTPNKGELRTDTVSDEDDTETFLKYETYLKMLGLDPSDLPNAGSVQAKVEEFEKEAKRKFVEEPANMKLLIVVDKLLTGFDAPPCTYLYIDKRMQDHGLFQAICRVNRLDDDTKDFGYIVDYKQLFGQLQTAMKDYTSGAFEGYDPEDVKGLVKDRHDATVSYFEEVYDAVEELCEGVEEPHGEIQYIHYFCGVSGQSEESDEIYARLREKLYRLVSSLVRAFAEAKPYLIDDISSGKLNEYDKKVTFYIELKKTIGTASGDFLDLKAYEPDMRKMIDNYITAADAEKIGDFDDLTLLDFVAKQGETLTGEGDSGHKEGAAEAIENNIRKKVIEKVTVNPRYYAKMSEILDKLIEERKQGVLDYAEMLEKYIKLAKDVDCPEDNDKYPESIRKSKALMAIYDNTGEDEKLALRIHKAVKKQALSGFRDNQVVVRRIKKALFEILGDDSEVERIYKIIEKQEEY